MMQASRYSAYAVMPFFQEVLARAAQECSSKVATTTQEPLVSPTAVSTPFCVSNTYHTVAVGETCDTIALARNVSSVDLFNGNDNIHNCSSLAAGSQLCLPLACDTYQLRSDDDCGTASYYAGVVDIRQFNPWINLWCDNLHAEAVVGSVLCVSPQGGSYNRSAPANSTSHFPRRSTGYGTRWEYPPSTPARDTTLLCGGWYVAIAGDACDKVLVKSGINMELFVAANPSVGASTCTTDLSPGYAYCIGPLRIFNIDYFYLGCYVRPGGNVLGDVSITVDDGSLFACGAYCLIGMGYLAFAMFNRTTCLCDEHMNNGSVLAASPFACNSGCPIAGECGGTEAYSVFSIHTDLAIYTPMEFPPELSPDNDDNDSTDAN